LPRLRGEPEIFNYFLPQKQCLRPLGYSALPKPNIIGFQEFSEADVANGSSSYPRLAASDRMASSALVHQEAKGGKFKLKSKKLKLAEPYWKHSQDYSQMVNIDFASQKIWKF
jgi:hypothetical protein